MAVIDTANPQFSTTNDLLEGVIAAGRAISKFRYGVIGRGATQTAAHERDLVDMKRSPLKPTSNHSRLEREQQLLRLNACKAAHLKMDSVYNGKKTVPLITPFMKCNQKAFGHVHFMHGITSTPDRPAYCRRS
jgi:hypothetical protein